MIVIQKKSKGKYLISFEIPIAELKTLQEIGKKIPLKEIIGASLLLHLLSIELEEKAKK